MSPSAAFRGYVGDLAKHDPRIWPLAVVQFVIVAGFSASMAFFALYLHAERGVPMERVGLLLMLTTLAAAPAQLFAGDASDRIGRRPLLITPLALRTLLFLTLAVFVLKGAPYPALVGLIFIDRILGGISLSVTDAMLADITPGSHRVEGYGLLRIGGNLGWALGPAVGGLLAERSYALVFAFTGILFMAATLISTRWLRESRTPGSIESPRGRDLIAAWRSRTFVLLSIASVLLFLVMGQMIGPLSVYSVEWRGLTTTQFGGLCTLNGVLVVVLQHPVSLLLRRLPPGPVLVVAALLYTGTFLALSAASSFMTFAACMVAMTLGEVLFVPSSVGLASRMGPPKEHGRYVGSFGLIRTIGWAGAPWVGGGLLDRFPGRPLAVWAPIAALALIASGLYLISSGGFARKMGISDIANGDLSLTALTNKNRAEKPPLSHPPD